MKKNKTDNKILFIDASKNCVKITNNNKLRDVDIDKIIEEYASREEVKYVTHLATYEEIEAQDFNLSVSTYVEQEDTREKIDIKVLNEDISKIVEKENKLRAEIDRIIAEIEE